MLLAFVEMLWFSKSYIEVEAGCSNDEREKRIGPMGGLKRSWEGINDRFGVEMETRIPAQFDCSTIVEGLTPRAFTIYFSTIEIALSGMESLSIQ